MNKNKPTRAIWWVRRDLRLHHNHALNAALTYDQVIPIYIHDEAFAKEEEEGAASKWWLHHSLERLNEQLSSKESKLHICAGKIEELAIKITQEMEADAVFWNMIATPHSLKLEKKLSEALKKSQIKSGAFSGSLAHTPWHLLKKDKSPYLVFGAFWRQFIAQYQSPQIAKEPKKLKTPNIESHLLCDLKDLQLLPQIGWDKDFYSIWQPGEVHAKKRAVAFINSKINHYNSQRDLPAVEATSRLSPSLHFGEITPDQILKGIEKAHGPIASITNPELIQFCKEIVWREFSAYLLFHFPHLKNQPLRAAFNSFPWLEDKKALRRWQLGQTGYPIVDAGMRQLWKTGWMHNRVRMVVASFLVKHLCMHWLHGQKWFADTLVDLDLASNIQGWQWTAGCGADAAPYFRVFNPITQGENFDPKGEYVKTWCPELKHLQAKWIHQPWNAPATELKKAQITLGSDYPQPMVEHTHARIRALAAFEKIKKKKE